VIHLKEEVDQIDMRWKGTMRQLQNEQQDLRFLVEQKDLKLKSKDEEMSKLKSKLSKVLNKIYLPS